MVKRTQQRPVGPVMLTLATGSDQGPTAPEAVKVIRESASTIATAVASMLDYLDEPLKSAFVKVKTDINTVLAGLPETDKVPAALNSGDLLRSLMYTFQMAQQMMTGLSEYSKQAKSEMQLARNSITGEVEKAVGLKITAGDLIKKADVQTQIDAAVTAARNEFTQSTKLLSDRRQLLTTASLPVPADTKLLGKDEEFNPRKDTAKNRAELLKPFKVEANQMITLCWDADQPGFDMALGLLKANSTTPAAPATPPKRASAFVVPSSQTRVQPEMRKRIGIV
jgi:hypothetical protein